MLSVQVEKEKCSFKRREEIVYGFTGKSETIIDIDNNYHVSGSGIADTDAGNACISNGCGSSA